MGRVLALKFRLGLFEQPYTGERPAVAGLRELSRRLARESVTLLAHDGTTLPCPARHGSRCWARTPTPWRSNSATTPHPSAPA
ncbi:hypothetical protein ACFQVA_40335 [Actinomadura keratinilytica]